MWALKMMPFQIDDSRVRMWDASIKEAEDLAWAIIKDGEWVVTQKGKIALAVMTTKYNGTTKIDEKASRLKEIVRGHGRHPGINDGYNTWRFEDLVAFMGFNKAMRIAIDYNSSIHKTVVGEDFLVIFKTHYFYESPFETFKCPARGPDVGKNEDGLHFRAWEVAQEAKGFSIANGKITSKYLIE